MPILVLGELSESRCAHSTALPEIFVNDYSTSLAECAVRPALRAPGSVWLGRRSLGRSIHKAEAALSKYSAARAARAK